MSSYPRILTRHMKFATFCLLLLALFEWPLFACVHVRYKNATLILTLYRIVEKNKETVQIFEVFLPNIVY